MSFNLGEIGRWCIQQPPATLFFKPLSLRWQSRWQEGGVVAKDLPGGKER